MEFFAKTKSVAISPRKVRLVVRALKNLSLVQVQNVLATLEKRPALVLQKIIKSAIANAIHNGKLKEESLVIKRIEVLDGPALKRFHPSTRGRVHPYKKRTSHITVIVGETYGTKN